VAAALVSKFQGAITTGPVYVHERPPEIVNPFSVIVMDPQPVAYATAGLGVDEATLPVTIVGGVETDDTIDAIKNQCRSALGADPTLGGVVHSCVATEERNWRSVTGAGGIQLRMVELILSIQM
jgi:hypothetical protein